MAAAFSSEAVSRAADPGAVAHDGAGRVRGLGAADGPVVSVGWTEVAGVMVLRLAGPVAPLADVIAEGLAAAVVDAPVILDVRHAELAVPGDVAVVLSVVAGAPVGPGRVCVVAAASGTRFGLPVFRTVGDALQAWCFARDGYGSGWR